MQRPPQGRRGSARQIHLRRLCALDDRVPAFLKVDVELVDRLFAKARDVPVYGILPKLGRLCGWHRLRQVQGVRIKAVIRIDMDNAQIGEEDGRVPCLFDSLSDPDGVERGAERGLWKESKSLGRVTPPLGQVGSPSSAKMRVSRANQRSVTSSPTETGSRSAGTAVRRASTGIGASGVWA